MSESSQRQRVVRLLRSLDAVPVENPIRPGTPDVNYIEGWLELKWLSHWPRSEVVRIEHFTPQQRRFLRRRWRAGGNAYLLLQVKREWLLFDGETAAEIVGLVGQVELAARCLKHFENGLDEELLRWLKR